MKVAFDDLFTGRGSEELAFSERAAALSGAEVEIGGFLVPLHTGGRYALVDTPGACPDCAPVPVAAIQLPGFRAAATGAAPVRLRGRLSYGYAIAPDGSASFLRIEGARIDTGLGRAAGR